MSSLRIRFLILTLLLLAITLIGMIAYETTSEDQPPVHIVKLNAPSTEGSLGTSSENGVPVNTADSRVDPYRPSMFGARSYVHLDQVFSSNWQAAKDGDPDAMYEVHQAIRQCKPVRGYSSYEEFLASDIASQLPAFIIETREAIFPECIVVNQHLPPGRTFHAWEASWFEEALLNDNPIAELDSIAGGGAYDIHPTGLEKLVLRALQSEHPFAYDHIKIMVVNRSDRSSRSERDINVVANFWGYMSCLKNAACEPQQFINSLSRTLYNHEIESIISASKRFESRPVGDFQIYTEDPPALDDQFQVNHPQQGDK